MLCHWCDDAKERNTSGKEHEEGCNDSRQLGIAKQVLSNERKSKEVNGQEPKRDEQSDKLAKTDVIHIQNVCHNGHDQNSDSGPHGALQDDREGVHVLVEAHDPQGLLHFVLTVFDHFVEDVHAGALKRDGADQDKDYKTEALNTRVVKGQRHFVTDER